MQPERMLSLVHLYKLVRAFADLPNFLSPQKVKVLLGSFFTAESACLDQVRSFLMNTEELEAGDFLHFSAVKVQGGITPPPPCGFLMPTIISLVLQMLRERLLPWHHVVPDLLSVGGLIMMRAVSGLWRLVWDHHRMPARSPLFCSVRRRVGKQQTGGRTKGLQLVLR